MKNKPVSANSNYQNLVTQISETYTHGYRKAVAAVNSNMVEPNWKIGQYIVDYEQGGSFKAKYGKALLENLATDFTRDCTAKVLAVRTLTTCGCFTNAFQFVRQCRTN